MSTTTARHYRPGPTTDLPVSVSPWVGVRDKRWPGTVREIHRQGVTLELNQPVEPRTLLHIESARGVEHELFPLLVFVRQARQLDEGPWRLECQFIKGLTVDELDDLLRDALG
jgi:hypothetical protein